MKTLKRKPIEPTNRSIELDGYRFVETNGDHLHQRLVNGEWKNLTGVSSVTKNITNFNIAAYYGSRRALMDLGYDPKDARNDVRGFKNVMSELLNCTDEEICEALYDAYKGHATYSRQRAEKGTGSHEVLDIWVKKCIEENNGYPIDSDVPVIKKVIEMTKHLEPQFIASEKHGYNDELWLGGICDLVVNTNIGLGIWDWKDRPMIYGKDLLQMGGYTHLFPVDFTHVLGIPLEGKEPRLFMDIPWLKDKYLHQLEVYRAMQVLEPEK